MGTDTGLAALKRELGADFEAEVLSLRRPPADILEAPFCIRYRDSRGLPSDRWIWVTDIETGDRGTFTARCYKRGELRTFRVDRIEEVVDGEGVSADWKTFLDILDGRENVGQAADSKQQADGSALLGCLVLTVIAAVVGGIGWLVL